jgi:hypothetical protein
MTEAPSGLGVILGRKVVMTGATGPWVPGSGVGRRPHRGWARDALPPATYDYFVLASRARRLWFAHWDSCTYAPVL